MGKRGGARAEVAFLAKGWNGEAVIGGGARAQAEESAPGW